MGKEPPFWDTTSLPLSSSDLLLAAIWVIPWPSSTSSERQLRRTFSTWSVFDSQQAHEADTNVLQPSLLSSKSMEDIAAAKANGQVHFQQVSAAANFVFVRQLFNLNETALSPG